jgi:hypothetical protein
VQPENIILHVIRVAVSQEAQRSLKQLPECYLLGKYNAKMLVSIFPVLPVEDDEISYVVGENRSLMADSIFKLLSITLPSPLQLQNMYDVAGPLSENLGENRSHILIEQKSDLRH